MKEPSELRKLAAIKMLQLDQENKGHIKAAQATKLYFKQVEYGMIEPAQTYEEFTQKVASLANQDLEVLEKAIELNQGNIKIGELDRDQATSNLSAEGQFMAGLLGE